jgi:hypothetical protein
MIIFSAADVERQRAGYREKRGEGTDMRQPPSVAPSACLETLPSLKPAEAAWTGVSQVELPIMRSVGWERMERGEMRWVFVEEEREEADEVGN